ncbi:MAG: secondary thiamine-phosphate synthase enzyme YjbQ [Ectothiorhodospiraceae bacterium]
MHQSTVTIRTRGRGLVAITPDLTRLLTQTGCRRGLLHVFIHHTSASLLIQENADVTVQEDLERFFARLVPDGDDLFAHTMEGPDDMPAHVRSALTQTELTVPLSDGRLALGTWQGIYLWEHRHRGHERRLTVTIQGADPV